MIKNSLIEKALIMALECQKLDSSSNNLSSIDQAKALLAQKYERDPNFHDLINKIVEKTITELP